ncbi:MAG: GyrI-like domain-containing protein [Deltaproteobacteria bacterium]|nr:GyrI-like domain-containing protein [Deltaproteobacteria bacterium]
MLKKTLLTVAAVVVIVLGVGFYWLWRGPDLSAYERFRDPAIVSMPRARVVLVEVDGHPEVVGGQAFGALFDAYFSLEGVAKGPGMPAPRARWPQTARDTEPRWKGRYAMPVPDAIVAVPPSDPGKPLQAKLDTWEYGDVAQILHVGPYDQEEPTIRRLHAFIKDQGLEAFGDHEEEYLRGPGMFGKGDPQQYYTLIRYRVREQGG